MSIVSGFAAPSAAEQDSVTKLRVVAYNVACGQWATPEQIAEVLKPLNPDIVLLSNEWTDGLVMRSLLEASKLENAVASRSIDHILYSTAIPIKLLDVQRDWGPKNQND